MLDIHTLPIPKYRNWKQKQKKKKSHFKEHIQFVRTGLSDQPVCKQMEHAIWVLKLQPRDSAKLRAVSGQTDPALNGIKSIALSDQQTCHVPFADWLFHPAS